jgi:hypothetical protein
MRKIHALGRKLSHTTENTGQAETLPQTSQPLSSWFVQFFFCDEQKALHRIRPPRPILPVNSVFH